ncbi:lipoate--protein ligase [Desulfomicrobium baculatum]|uniref:lipoate--protein ligase n=1 Tax=Desulfomicrobium baculatum (strain DSM 4028 / VKM B-1378 / X) TaxID=525897 RepID=C7LPC2_DESBD|nr:lipoate--protein ligase [Desulfomicrobium baculatum]ACU88965.1 lipoyltransferase and lipoate-protein ligase [Desulfomicrobium baculatum DSM 4028]
MRFIHNTCTNPAFNLAAEEWLLRNTDTDIFMLWRNEPAVIVGRNQNTVSEIDEEFVRERGISVIRRLTGGGAVFHDLGNVNFTFIQLGKQSRHLDFHRFTAPIMEALQAMGVNCQFEGRNDLVIDGQKFSGNAQLLEKDRVLHHGTLLFSSQMADLSGALKVNPVKYADKAVKSVTKRVTNISSHLPEPIDVETFVHRVMAHISGHESENLPGLRTDEEAAINELVESKYGTWDWNFGSSPNYGFTRSTRTEGGVVEVHLDVQHGRIEQARIFGDFFGARAVSELESLLAGCRHERGDLSKLLEDVPVGDFIRNVDAATFIDCLF